MKDEWVIRHMTRFGGELFWLGQEGPEVEGHKPVKHPFGQTLGGEKSTQFGPVALAKRFPTEGAALESFRPNGYRPKDTCCNAVELNGPEGPR